MSNLPIKKTQFDFPFRHAGKPDEYGVSVGNYTTIQSNYDSRAIYNQDELNEVLDCLKSEDGADNIVTSDTRTVQEVLDSLDNTIDTMLYNISTNTSRSISNLANIDTNTNDINTNEEAIGILASSNITMQNEISNNTTRSLQNLNNIAIVDGKTEDNLQEIDILKRYIPQKLEMGINIDNKPSSTALTIDEGTRCFFLSEALVTSRRFVFTIYCLGLYFFKRQHFCLHECKWR